MNLNGIGRVIQNRRAEEAVDKLDAMRLLGTLTKDAGDVIVKRFTAWSILMAVYGSDGSELKLGVKKNVESFMECWRAREADCAIIEDAFARQNAEVLKPLAEPIPEKFQPDLDAIRAQSDRAKAESRRQADAIIGGLRRAFPDMLPPEEHNCADCPDDLRKVCPLPAAEEWRAKNP